MLKYVKLLYLFVRVKTYFYIKCIKNIVYIFRFGLNAAIQNEKSVINTFRIKIGTTKYTYVFGPLVNK